MGLGSRDRDRRSKEGVSKGCGYLFSITPPGWYFVFSLIFLCSFCIIFISCYSIGFSCVLISSFKSFLRQLLLFSFIHSLPFRVYKSSAYEWKSQRRMRYPASTYKTRKMDDSNFRVRTGGGIGKGDWKEIMSWPWEYCAIEAKEGTLTVGQLLQRN